MKHITNDQELSNELAQKTKYLNLLYVENNEESKISEKEVLDKFFDNITIATNGQDGLDKYMDNKYDLIITDIEMPILTGLEMIRKIREADYSTPILTLTSFDKKDYLVECIELNVDGYLEKPLILDKFLKILQKILHKLEIRKSKEHEDNLLLETMNKEVTNVLKHTRESIEYAALIQSSLIPDNHIFRKYFQEYFVIWHPKDTVGGDIYLFNELRGDNECLIMCIDCTGHGVPGAFVTMLVKAVEAQLLAEIYANPDMEISTAWIMGFYNNRLKKMLKQDNPESVSNVGWDGSVLYYNKETKIIKFSGAESPFFYRKPDGEIVTVKGTRKSVGYKQCPYDYEYKETIIENIEDGTKIFLTTDGYLDQNGGEKDFPFGKKRFIQIIEDYGEESMADLQEMFMYEMAEWEEQIENNDRNDDMTVIGFTI